MVPEQTRLRPLSEWIEKYRDHPERIPLNKEAVARGDYDDYELFDLRLFMEDWLGCDPDIGDDEEMGMVFEDDLQIFLDSGNNIARAMILLQNTPIKDWPYKCRVEKKE